MEKDTNKKEELEELKEKTENSTEEKSEDILETEDITEEAEDDIVDISEDKSDKKTSSAFKSIVANILDQAIMLAASVIILLVFDFIIRKFGYMVSEPVSVLLVIYFIVSCIYSAILEKTKLKSTIGKKILHV